MSGLAALKKTELALLGGAIVYCLGILYLDIRTSSDFTEAFLYTLALIIIYPVKRSWAILGITVLGIGFIILGKLVEEQSESGFGVLTNRAMASVVLGAFGFLLWKVVRYEQELFRLSTSDSLTGALNRRHFMAQMGREQKRAERYGARYSLLMLDIDHFKRINDGFGHQVGDEAIRRMADTCNAHLRPTDLLCRYGGEEFIIALTHTEEVGALIAAERIREAVAKIEIPADGKTVRYTVSIGVAPFGITARLEDVIEAADQALYAAKTGGRNQVRLAGAARAPREEVATAASA